MYQIEVCYSKEKTNQALLTMQNQGYEIENIIAGSIWFTDGTARPMFTIIYRRNIEPLKDRRKETYDWRE